jgi:pimeloyl-ACP methyl ester carboxylesterase
MIERLTRGKMEAARNVAASPDGIPIAYEVRGEGSPALVFIHGWSCDRSYWQAQVKAFAQKHQVITIDLAGHGESGLGRASWTMESFGGDVFAVLEKLAVQSMVLIGHSMGGDVILEAARRLPGRVQAMVWIDTYRQLPSYRSPEEIQERLAPFRADFTSTARAFVRGMFHSDTDALLVERVVSHMSSAPADVAMSAAAFAWSYGPEVDVALKELKLPLVAINPEKPPTDVASMNRHGVDVVLMPGVGHFPMMEDPKHFNELLSKVVERFRE